MSKPLQITIAIFWLLLGVAVYFHWYTPTFTDLAGTTFIWIGILYGRMALHND